MCTTRACVRLCVLVRRCWYADEDAGHCGCLCKMKKTFTAMELMCRIVQYGQFQVHPVEYLYTRRNTYFLSLLSRSLVHFDTGFTEERSTCEALAHAGGNASIAAACMAPSSAALAKACSKRGRAASQKKRKRKDGNDASEDDAGGDAGGGGGVGDDENGDARVHRNEVDMIESDWDAGYDDTLQGLSDAFMFARSASMPYARGGNGWNASSVGGDAASAATAISMLQRVAGRCIDKVRALEDQMRRDEAMRAAEQEERSEMQRKLASAEKRALKSKNHFEKLIMDIANVSSPKVTVHAFRSTNMVYTSYAPSLRLTGGDRKASSSKKGSSSQTGVIVANTGVRTQR